MTGPHVQVIATGAPVGPIELTAADMVICADGGIASALAAGRAVDLVVGDLDSATTADLDAVRASGAVIERHPENKDESDLELALAAAIARDAAHITVHLDAAGRLDHQLANLLVLASPRWRWATVDAWVGADPVWVVWDRLELALPPGAPVAIQAVVGAAVVTTLGLAYPLHGEELLPTQARGIANVVESTPAEISVSDGVVLVVASGGQPAQAT